MQELNGFSVPKGFRGGSGIKVQLWWAVQATLFAWSPQILYRWRAFLLRLFGAKIGKNVVIRPSVKITYPICDLIDFMRRISHSTFGENYLSLEINAWGLRLGWG